MSKLLRLPLTLLAVLAAMLFLPGLAWADTPTAAQCASASPPTGCVPASGGGTSANDTTGGTTTQQPKTAPAPKDGGGTTGQQPEGHSTDKPAAGLPVVPFQVPDQARGPVVGLDAVVPAASTDICTSFPQIPACNPKPPAVPLTCDGLAQLLGQTGGCPSSFSCQDLAKLLGITCPAGPPDCQALADLFHLQGCPQPPKDCSDFAKLLKVQDCSQIPCLDTSKLPQQARDGLQQLFDGLKNIGIKQCPAPPTVETTPPGKGTYMPPTEPAAQQQRSPY